MYQQLKTPKKKYVTVSLEFSEYEKVVDYTVKAGHKILTSVDNGVETTIVKLEKQDRIIELLLV